MRTIVDLAQERTDLQPEQIDRLLRIIEAWSLIADLSLSDLVLWLPTWNDGGVIAAALVRPTTASTTVEEDLSDVSDLPKKNGGKTKKKIAMNGSIVKMYKTI